MEIESISFFFFLQLTYGLPSGTEAKNLPATQEVQADLGSIPGLGRFPGEDNGNPLQVSCWDNPMDRGTWWPTAHSVSAHSVSESDTTERAHIYTVVQPKHQSG